MMRTWQASGLSLLALCALGSPAFADDTVTPPPPDNPAPPPGGTPTPGPDNTLVGSVQTEKPDRGAFILGVKFGGLFAEPFTSNHLGPSFLADVEVGYVLPYLKRSFGLMIDVGYTQPEASGDQTDPRIVTTDMMPNAWHFDLTQRELLLGLTVVYRMTFIGSGRIAPYIGIGPRLWLLQTKVEGTAGANNPISESTEQSTKVGLSVPIGVDFEIGPGRLFLEGQVLWAPVDHRTTGDSSVGALTIEAGYRFFL
jgi:opacity protein-like surface antigen